MTPAFSRSYASAYDLLNCDKPYAGEAEFVQELYEAFCRSRQGIERVLDLGCGSGLHLSLLPDTMHKTGVDISEAMLQIASSRNIPKSDFIRSAISDYRSEDKFDLIYSLFHVMSYQASVSDLLGALRTMSYNLDSDGLVVFDFWHRAAWEHDPPSVRLTTKSNDKILVKRVSSPTLDYVTGLVSIDIDVFVRELEPAEGNYVHFSERHEMRAFTIQELELAAAMCELRVVGAGPWMTVKRQLTANDWYGWVALQRAVPK